MTISKHILIIDDKDWSADRLMEKIKAFDSEIVIHGPAKTCAEARAALLARDDYNLIFSCSSLPDGDLMEVFREMSPQSFVIFTTLSDERTKWVVENLKHAHLLGARNDIRAIDLLDWLWQASLRLLGISHVKEATMRHKERLLVRRRGKLISLPIHEILYFKRAGDYVLARMADGKEYEFRDTILNLQRHLDPYLFFPINRQYLLSRHALGEVEACGISMCVTVKHSDDITIIISRNRKKVFMDWKNQDIAEEMSDDLHLQPDGEQTEHDNH